MVFGPNDYFVILTDVLPRQLCAEMTYGKAWLRVPIFPLEVSLVVLKEFNRRFGEPAKSINQGPARFRRCD